MTVGKICQREIHFAELTESVLAAAKRMRRRRVGALVVVNPLRRPIGIVTDRDIVARGIGIRTPLERLTVEDVMTRPVKSVREDTPIELAVSLMRSGGFRRLPVVDRLGRLIGIVTLDDVLGLLSAEFAQIGSLLDRSVPRSMAERNGASRRKLVRATLGSRVSAR